MHKVCKNSIVFAFVFTLCISGCQRKNDDQKVYTRIQWIYDLHEEIGIQDNDVLTSLEQYGVIENPQIVTDEALDRDFASYTLSNLVGIEEDETEIVDIEEAIYPKHIRTAIHNGYFALDKKKAYPKKQVTEEEAHELLHIVTKALNDPIMKTVDKVTFDENKSILHQEPLTFDSETMTITLPKDSRIQDYQSIHWLQNEEEYIYDIASFEVKDEKLVVKLKEADLLDLTESMELEGESALDFSKIEFTPDEPEAIPQSMIQTMHAHPVTQKTINYKGFKIICEYGVTGISATVSKELNKALSLETRLKMSGMNVKYRFFTKQKSIDNAFFKVNLHTEESVALKSGNYKSLYGDFSAVDPENFLPSLKGFLKPKEEIETVNIPIATVKIPLESSRILTVKAKLNVVLYATGQASLVLSQDSMLGMEMRNGVPRFIKDFSHAEKHALRADASVTGRLTFSLDTLNYALLDFSVETGAKAKFVTTVHLFDKDNEHREEITNLPSDAVDALSIGNGNILVCSDVNAYLVLRLIANSANSLLGKFGFGASVDILNENTGSLLGGTIHLENGQIKDHCTYRERDKKFTISPLPEKDQLKVATYGIALKINESKPIEVTAYPKGYTSKDFTFTSNDPLVAVVKAGRVYGLSEGSCGIDIISHDGLYRVQISILVTGNKQV